MERVPGPRLHLLRRSQMRQPRRVDRPAIATYREAPHTTPRRGPASNPADLFDDSAEAGPRLGA